MITDEVMGQAEAGVLNHPVGAHQLAWLPAADRPMLIDAVDWLLFGFCDGELTVGELAEDLMASVDISADDAMRRVGEAHLNLRTAGLLVGHDSPVAPPLDHFPYPPNN